MIWWNGVSSDDLHLYVERYPSRKLPVRKTTFYSVPGRTGDYVYQQNAWENYTQAYDIYISAEDRKLPNAMTAITAWLYSANGYAKLEDSYDLDTYRMAVFEGGQDVENYLNRYGKATIEFNCKPQRWLASGDEWIDLTSSDYYNPLSVMNPTGMPSKPFVKLSGTGFLGMSYRENIDGASSNFYITDMTGIQYVDCESMMVWYDDDVVEDPYEQIGGVPEWILPPVLGNIHLSRYLAEESTLSELKIKPRWFSL